MTNQQIKVLFSAGSFKLDLVDSKGKEVHVTEFGKSARALFRFADKTSFQPIEAKKSYWHLYYPLPKLFEFVPGEYELFISYSGGVRIGRKTISGEKKYGPFKIAVK